MRFLCVGEGLIDVVKTTDGPDSEHVGGSVFNVACGLGRLGQEVSLASWWGADERGERLNAAAKAAGVEVVEGTCAAPRTPVALAMLDSQGKATYDFQLTWNVPDFSTAQYSHIHVGSYSALLDEGWAKIMRIIRERGTDTTLSYDPNIRPDLVGDRETARSKVEEIVALSDIVKVSDEDLAFLYPQTDRRVIAKKFFGGSYKLRKPGAQIVVITLGSKGAELYTPWLPRALRISPDAGLKIGDTIGAGDSFMAGLLVALQHNRGIGLGRGALGTLDSEELKEILCYANTTAQITVQHNGAYAPTSQEVDQALRK